MTSTSLQTPNSRPGRGRVRVTYHFHDGVRQEACVERHELGALEDRPRRRRVSIEWDEAPKLVLLAANPGNGKALEALPRLVEVLRRMPRVVVAVDEANAGCVRGIATVKAGDVQNGKREMAESMEKLCLNGGDVYKAEEVDLVITLGGDGLILHVISHMFPQQVPPFMPFNMGSMGFLTPFDVGRFERDVKAVLEGENNTVTMRMRLKCVVVRQLVEDASQSPCVHNFEDNMLSDEGYECSVREELHVLNELVIDRGPAPYLSNLEVLCDDRLVTRVQADGIIVATPTGSTAYSLSAGGSMVHPNVPAILFTPICPHSLSFRPVLFPDYVTLQIKVPKDSRASAWISFDGRHRMELRKGDRVVVSVSPWSVPTFSKVDTTNDWFASVSQCLRWNERVVQGGGGIGE